MFFSIVGGPLLFWEHNTHKQLHKGHEGNAMQIRIKLILNRLLYRHKTGRPGAEGYSQVL
jgi:hypothetical protein